MVSISIRNTEGAEKVVVKEESEGDSRFFETQGDTACGCATSHNDAANQRCSVPANLSSNMFTSQEYSLEEEKEQVTKCTQRKPGKRKAKHLQNSLSEIDEEDHSFENHKKSKRQSKSKKQGKKAKPQTAENHLTADGHFERTFTNIEEVEKDTFSAEHKLDRQSYLVQRFPMMVPAGSDPLKNATF